MIPGLANLLECYHTKLITTMPIAKINGAQHMELKEENARECARDIIKAAIEAFGSRKPEKIISLTINTQL